MESGQGWFDRTVELDAEVQSLGSRLDDVERKLGQAVRARRYEEVARLDALRDDLRLDLRYVTARKKYVYMNFGRDELRSWDEADADDLVRLTTDACVAAVDAVIGGFMHRLTQEMHAHNSGLETLLAFGAGLGFHDELTGTDDPQSAVKLLAERSGDHYGGLEFDGRRMEFIDRCQAVEQFADSVKRAVLESLEQAVDGAQRDVHQAQSLNGVEKPCVSHSLTD